MPLARDSDPSPGASSLVRRYGLVFCSGVVGLSSSLDVVEVIFGPAAESIGRTDEGGSEIGEGVVDPGRDSRIETTSNQSVPLQITERLGEHLLRDAVDGTAQLAEPADFRG